MARTEHCLEVQNETVAEVARLHRTFTHWVGGLDTLKENQHDH